MEKVVIAGFAGSLRKDSYNKAILNTVKKYAPSNVEVKILDLRDLPFYNQDLENNIPESVRKFKEEIRKADAVLIATPEYNRSVPGVLKNAIDWASRPPQDNVFYDKPVAVVGATAGGVVGTALAQYHLRQILSFLNAHVVEQPEVYIAKAGEKVKDGVYVDEETIKWIKLLIEKLVEWTIRLKKKQIPALLNQ